MGGVEGATTLDGLGVLVTRPAGQADTLAALIEQSGGEAIRFPTVAIAPPEDDSGLNHALGQLARSDLAVFVSANAVTHALAALAARDIRWPARVPAAAVGRATAAALHDAGIREVIVPRARYDSEGLLALPALQTVTGKTIIVFRGEDGRELLAANLRARGAHVIEAQCYRRVLPPADPRALVERLRANKVHVVTATSVETLTNLLTMIPASEHTCIRALPLVVISTRVAEAARALGFQNAPVISREPSDRAILEAILAWHRQATSR